MNDKNFDEYIKDIWKNEVSKFIINSHAETYIHRLERENKQLQSNWNSLREWVKNEDNWYYDIDCSGDKRYIFININDLLDKMNELEGADNENN